MISQNALTSKVSCIRYSIVFRTLNNAIVPIHNMNMYVGMLYDILEQGNPSYASKSHKDHGIKPYNFDHFRVQRMRNASKGLYCVSQNTTITWNMVTIDSDFAIYFMKGLNRMKKIHFGKLELQFQTLEIQDLTNTMIRNPDEIDTITLRLHTNTFYQKKEEKQPFSDLFLQYQSHLLSELHVLNENKYETLKPNLRILRNDLTEIVTHISEKIFEKGNVGYITFKITGSDAIKQRLYQLLFYSQFIGIGSKRGFGFGYNSIQKITYL